MRRLLWCVLLAPALLLPGLRAGEESLANQDVVDLLKAGLAKELVVEKIKSCENTFDLSTRAMIQLKEAAVPDDVIALMLQEAKGRRNKARSKLLLEVQNLTTDRPEVRDSAFTHLSRAGDAGISALQEGLASTRPEIRAACAAALSRLNDAESARLVRNLLIDAVPEVRYAAADALAVFKDEIALDVARKALTGELKPADGYFRLLGRLKDTGSAPMLRVRLLEDSDPLARAQAAAAIGEIGGADNVEALEHGLLKDRALPVRNESAIGLGKIKAPGSAAKLIQSCKKDPEVRQATLTALGAYPTHVAAPFLIYVLGHNLTASETAAALASLRRLTHQDLGGEVGPWKQWWDKNRETIEREAGIVPAAPEAVEKPAEPAGEPTATVEATPAAPEAPEAKPAKEGAAKEAADPWTGTAEPAPALPPAPPDDRPPPDRPEEANQNIDIPAHAQEKPELPTAPEAPVAPEAPAAPKAESGPPAPPVEPEPEPEPIPGRPGATAPATEEDGRRFLIAVSERKPAPTPKTQEDPRKKSAPRDEPEAAPLVRERPLLPSDSPAPGAARLAAPPLEADEKPAPRPVTADAYERE